MVEIPAGEFLMGNAESVADMAAAFPLYGPERFKQAFNDEYPRHAVRISRPFLLGECPVTVGQFKQFLGEAGGQSEAERDGTGGYGFNAETGTLDTARNRRHTWLNPGWEQTDEHPVVNVTWQDAVDFCDWLSRREAERYRLPTEAEWEYACRAGTTTRFWCGDDPEELTRFANVYDAAKAKVFPEWERFAPRGDGGHAFTAPVGSFQPNPFGLFDMHGNVWEWVQDFHGGDYYAHSSNVDPQGPPIGARRVRRGGGWMSWPLYARSAFRNYNTPQSRYYNLGFRVARSL